MRNELEKLSESTTIVKMEDNRQGESKHSKANPNIKWFIPKLIHGNDNYISRFQRNRLVGQKKVQVDLNTLNSFWKKKWDSFGEVWNKERQNFRFFQESFSLFYYSFEQLDKNKISAVSEEDNKREAHLEHLINLNLYGMYQNGKKSIDLAGKRCLKIIREEDSDFCERFSESRNKFFEHNHNPRGFQILIDPKKWSLKSTNSLLRVDVHNDRFESICTGYIDYYEDYFKLEKILVNAIKRM